MRDRQIRYHGPRAYPYPTITFNWSLCRLNIFKMFLGRSFMSVHYLPNYLTVSRKK
jgi:hypothetical protein